MDVLGLCTWELALSLCLYKTVPLQYWAYPYSYLQLNVQVIFSVLCWNAQVPRRSDEKAARQIEKLFAMAHPIKPNSSPIETFLRLVKLLYFLYKCSCSAPVCGVRHCRISFIEYILVNFWIFLLHLSYDGGSITYRWSYLITARWEFSFLHCWKVLLLLQSFKSFKYNSVSTVDYLGSYFVLWTLNI